MEQFIQIIFHFPKLVLITIIVWIAQWLSAKACELNRSGKMKILQ